jgi:hypothetical protein
MGAPALFSPFPRPALPSTLSPLFAAAAAAARFACGPEGVHRGLTQRYIEASTLLLAPITPHTCDHVWTNLLKREGTVLTAGAAARGPARAASGGRRRGPFCFLIWPRSGMVGSSPARRPLGTGVLTRAHTCTHHKHPTYTLSLSCARTHTHARTRTHTHTHTHTHQPTNQHTYIHTRTHAPRRLARV